MCCVFYPLFVHYKVQKVSKCDLCVYVSVIQSKESDVRSYPEPWQTQEKYPKE